MSILFCVREEKYQVQMSELNISSLAINESATNSLPNALLVGCSFALIQY